VCEVLSDEDESLRCKEKLPFLRLSEFDCDASDATAVYERWRESGEAEIETVDFAG
jgi:hypothetical protein